MPRRQPIKGQVASVLTDRQLVINRGAEHGVEEQMIFAVLNRNAIEIKDPETGQLLGNAPIAKVVVEARVVEERFTVCSTFRTKRVGGGGLLSQGFTDYFAPEREVRETLRRSDNSSNAVELDARDSIIGIGDPVVEVDSADQYPVADF